MTLLAAENNTLLIANLMIRGENIYINLYIAHREEKPKSHVQPPDERHRRMVAGVALTAVAVVVGWLHPSHSVHQ